MNIQEMQEEKRQVLLEAKYVKIEVKDIYQEAEISIKHVELN
jgi:hypothetical protein